MSPEVLVVGAGPAGLVTALQAAAHGAAVRIVERRPEAFRPSRALITHPRTLESLRPLGVTDALLERGDPAPQAELHLGGRHVSAALTDVPLRDTAYPHLTLLRQADVETVLTDALARRGVAVERGTELVTATANAAAASATLRRDGAEEQVRCRFLVGGDGQDSTVRRCAGIGWDGGTYREEVVLADLELDGDPTPDVLHVAAGRSGLIFLFALGETATWRLLATRPGGDDELPFGRPTAEVPATDVDKLLDEAGLGASLRRLTWSARVRLQHRVARRFRAGRLFLVGDAAHTHSPAAAQGMNTGILDAVNLGWKLGFAANSGPAFADPDGTALLNSYEAERRPVARQVLTLTHGVFFAEASTHPAPAFLRGTLVPALAPALPVVLRQRFLLAQLVRVLSQMWVRYRRSPLSVEGRPAVGPGPRAGDRLPDREVSRDGTTVRLHELTARPGVHLLLDSGAERPDDAVLGPWVTVHRLPDRPGRGLRAARPDGHLGFRCGVADPAQLTAWLDLIGARPGVSAPSRE